VEQRRVDALLLRLDDLEKEIARLEALVAEAKRQRTAADPVTPTAPDPNVPAPMP